jgi:hypothetical protein
VTIEDYDDRVKMWSKRSPFICLSVYHSLRTVSYKRDREASFLLSLYVVSYKNSAWSLLSFSFSWFMVPTFLFGSWSSLSGGPRIVP